jgi:hypothetical protein
MGTEKMTPQQQQEFHRSAQGLLTDPETGYMPAHMRGQEMVDAPGKSPVGSGYWGADGNLEINPMTEYRTKGVLDPATSGRDAAYANFVLAQDGSATTKLSKGRNRGQTPDTTSSIMVPNRTSVDDLRKTLDDSGMVFDEDYFLSPGEQGTHVGLFGDPAEHKRVMETLGPVGGKAYHQRSGGTAYQGGHNADDSGKFKSRKREAEALMDTYNSAGEGELLDDMLHSTAGRYKGAYRGMEGASGAKPHPESVDMWQRILDSPDVSPQDTINKMIKDGDLTKLDGQKMMQQLMGQPEGLLA